MSSRLEVCRPRFVLVFFASRVTDIRRTMLQLKYKRRVALAHYGLILSGGLSDSVDRHSAHCRRQRRGRGGREAGNLPEACCRVNLIVPGEPGDSQGENENVVVAEAARRKRAEAALPQDLLFSSPPASYGTLMSSRTVLVTEAEAIGPAVGCAPNSWTFLSLLLLSGWCGLVAGLLEVAAIVVRKQVFDTDRFLRMSRHFVWLVPVSNVAVFLTLGFLGCGIILVWPRRGRWLYVRVLGAFVILPALLVAFSRIYSLAWLAVALGLAARFVPILERMSRSFRRFVLVSFPAALAILALLGGSVWVGDQFKQRRENSRPLPPLGTPNVLLIVLDTVAARHLSLHGYDRPTSTSLIELARRAIRFDTARATSSWTLPSHASMFTGRWMHDLSVGWLTPLDRTAPTLAEFLGERGYATAGFVANMGYCAADSGLSRGFTRYQDYIFPELTVFKTAVLVNRAIENTRAIIYYSEDWLEAAGLLSYTDRMLRAIDDADRKAAGVINHEFLDWLSRRTEPERPFFAFLNYNDAHYPYLTSAGKAAPFRGRAE